MTPHKITINIPGAPPKTVPLASERLTLGRASNNDLAYPEDSGLSRQHMRLEADGADWLVRDLGSKNGTLVNDDRITGAVILSPGDRIVASRITLIFDGEEESRPSFEGTVVFDVGRTVAEKPPTHTVTLGDLIPRGEKAAGEQMQVPGEWADPVTALVRAGRALVANKPLKELFEDILDLSLEAVGAGRGVLLALEKGKLEVQALRGDEFHISTAVRDRVLKQRSSLMITDAMSDEALKQRESIVMQGVRSLMAVPLQTDEDVLGLIYVDTPHMWREFQRSDLNLLTVMANVAAIRIERERHVAAEQSRKLMERDLNQAAEIQQQLLPRQAPDVAGLEMVGYNRACRTVGGDYYDFVQHTDGKVIVALGDVAGKGMPASLLMVNLQARVQMLAEQPGTAAQMVGNLNKAMIKACPSNRFITFFLCQIDPATGEVTYSNAGHNPPFHVKANGEVVELGGGGPVLGILPGIEYEDFTLKLEKGESIVLYTDGVSEAANPKDEEYGEQRLGELLKANPDLDPSDAIGTIRADVEKFCAGAPAADDFTVVVVRRSK